MKLRWLKRIGLLLVLIVPFTVAAEDKKTIAVLPFTVHSAENIDYVKNGIWDMLYSRLSSGGEVNLVSRQAVLEALSKLKGKDYQADDVYQVGKALNADYVVWGSITKFGSSLSLDGKLMDIAGNASPIGVFEQCPSLDDVIPRVNDFAKKIQMYALGKVPQSVLPAPAAPPSSPQVSPPSPATAAPGSVEALKTPEGTFTAVINPDFINAPEPIDRKGFWMTPRYSYEFKGLDIGDVNGDGLNEVVVISPSAVHIFQRKGDALVSLERIEGKEYDDYLAVDVADINENGIPEIIVTSINWTTLNSFVVEYRDGRFQTIASDLRWFLRVVRPLGRPVLIGQAKGFDDPFIHAIHEIIWQDGTYVEGKRMPIPEGLSVYGLAYDSLDGSTRLKLVMLDEYDRIRIYEPTLKRFIDLDILGGSEELLWKSDDHYGGSNNAFLRITYAGQPMSDWAIDDNPDKVSYVKLRVLTYDMNKNGKNDVIIVKNLSAVGRIMRNLTLYTSSEIYDFEWDGIGLSENWKTKKIQGYVADYQIKDIDNDGEDEVVLSLVVSFSGSLRKKSILAAYDLTVPERVQ